MRFLNGVFYSCCLVSPFDDSPLLQLLHREEIHWYKFNKEVHRLVHVAARESPLQLNKTWFRGSFFKKPKRPSLNFFSLKN